MFTKECNLPCRIAENVHTSSNCPALQNKSNPVVSDIDRKYHLEAYFIFFVAKNSLLLLSVPKLIKFTSLKLKMNRRSQI